ncbi:hypothetical protein DD563_13050 [Pelagicola sp. LXJ1103]|nr:hypothetical protein DD563_13050 [Pelagicola sp. LXJ1103]
MNIVRLADLKPTPWKNGGGITRDIAAARDGAGLLWRLSMADVDRDGDFSSFAGLTRVLTVIEGSGMILHGPSGGVAADFAAPVTFEGGAAVRAELTQGPIRDFNLMFDTARYDGSAVRVAGGPLDLGGAGQIAVLHLITGGATIGAHAMAPGDTAICEGSALNATLAEDACALAITLAPRP